MNMEYVIDMTYAIRHIRTGKVCRNYGSLGLRTLFFIQQMGIDYLLQSDRKPSMRIFAVKRIAEDHIRQLNKRFKHEFELVELPSYLGD